MTEILLILVMGVYAFANQRHDALNLGKYKWPNCGFRIIWSGMDVHYLRAKDLVLDEDGIPYDESSEDHVKVVKTIDTWHRWKWLMFYILPVYMIFTLDVAWWAWVVATAVGTLTWKLLPRPEHWE